MGTWTDMPIVILGSGESINSLSAQERDFLNRCDVLIGLNKFMAFSDLAGIRPTHVFIDNYHSLHCDVFLQLNFDFCRQHHIEGVTFILHRKMAGFRRIRIDGVPIIVDPELAGPRSSWRLRAARVIRKFAAIPRDRRMVGETARVSLSLARKAVKRSGPKGGEAIPDLEVRMRAFVLPSSCKYEYVAHTHWFRPKNEEDWATSLDQPLYHHRGSLTSAINYAAIVWPGRDILLVGTDLYSSRYFFEDSERYKKHKVLGGSLWVDDVTAGADRHFGAVEHEGTTMFDSFQFINEKLSRTGNRLYCANEKSLLVEYGCVAFKEMIPT